MQNFEIELFYSDVNAWSLCAGAARAPTRQETTQCGSQTVEELFSLGAKSRGNASNSSFMRQERLNIHQSANLLNCETKRCEEN